MKTIIHVNQHVIKANAKTGANDPVLTDNPYYVKLWAEIDALRERQMKLAKTIRVNT